VDQEKSRRRLALDAAVTHGIANSGYKKRSMLLNSDYEEGIASRRKCDEFARTGWTWGEKVLYYSENLGKSGLLRFQTGNSSSNTELQTQKITRSCRFLVFIVIAI
jgi:hypothetical protein